MISAYSDRLEIIDCRSDSRLDTMKQDVSLGLSEEQKYLPSKYFYDSRGSALFEQICLLPEYYQTRTELSLLKRNARAVMEGLREGSLIELGSGSNWKIRHLLDAANGSRSRIRYVPVDICEGALVGSAEELLCLYPDISISARVADFMAGSDYMRLDGCKLITFFGGTIGNFTDDERTLFLKSLAAMMDPRDRLLIGLDLVKNKEVIEAAYNDEQGITAQFNKNMLNVVNRELNGTFNDAAFDHLAYYNETSERVEMHLQANEDTDACIADIDLDITVRKKETIFTEVSRKFRKETVARMAGEAGLRVSRWFTDRREWFALVEMKKVRKNAGKK